MFFKQLIHLKLCIIIEATFLLALLEAEIDMARGVGEYLEEKKRLQLKTRERNSSWTSVWELRGAASGGGGRGDN